MAQRITDTDLKRTLLGIVPSFDKIFTGARYAKRLYSDSRRGTAYDYREGEIFLGTDWNTRDLLPNCVPCGKVLACTPAMEMPKFAPRIGRAADYSAPVGPSCINIIAWRNVDHFLVTAGDPNHIRDVWIGFVPMDQQFEIEEA